MLRVRDVPPEEVDPALRDAYLRFAGGYGSFRGQVGVLAHVPPAMYHLTTMLLELRAQQNVPLRYIELCIVVVSKLNECHFCVAQHQPLLEIEGLSAQGADRVLDYADHPEFDEVDKAVVEYAIGVTTDPKRIRETLFARLREAFTDAQIVELTLRISLCGFFNRFNEALGIDA